MAEIEIINFRLYDDNRFQFDDFNCIIGQNGTGKSSLLEAINEWNKNKLDEAKKNIFANSQDKYCLKFTFYLLQNQIVNVEDFYPSQIILPIGNYIFKMTNFEDKILVKSDEINIPALNLLSFSFNLNKIQENEEFYEDVCDITTNLLELGLDFDTIDDSELFNDIKKSKLGYKNPSKSDLRFNFSPDAACFKNLILIRTIIMTYSGKYNYGKDFRFSLSIKSTSSSNTGGDYISQFNRVNQLILQFFRKKIKISPFNYQTRYLFEQPIEISSNSFKNSQFFKALLKQVDYSMEKFSNLPELQKRKNIGQMNEIINHYLNNFILTRQFLKVQIDLIQDQSVRIQFQFFDGNPISYQNLSAGYQWIIKFFFHFYDILAEKNLHKIILIDEPGTFLHPGAQKEILEFLSSLKNYSQVIYTTHMPALIDFRDLKSIHVLDFETESDGNFRRIIELPIGDMEIKSKIISSLGISFNHLLFFPRYMILVEGKSDLIFFNNINRFYHLNDLDARISLSAEFFDMGTINQVPYLAKHFDKIQYKNFVMIVDNDFKENSAENKKNPLNRPDVEKIRDRIIILNKEGIQSNIAIEDFIPKSIFGHTLESYLDNYNGNGFWEKYKKEINFEEISQSKLIHTLEKHNYLDKTMFMKSVFQNGNEQIFIQDNDIKEIFLLIKEKLKLDK